MKIAEKQEEIENTSDVLNEAESTSKVPVAKKTNIRDLWLARFVYNLCVAFAVLFIINIFFTNIVFFPMAVSGPSMQPTLNAMYSDGKLKLWQKGDPMDTVYVGRFGEIQRGDIVVFDSGELDENGDVEYYIKRVLGVPGDVISFVVDGGQEWIDVHNFRASCHIVVNGQVVDESGYILESMALTRFSAADHEYIRVTLAENQYAARDGFVFKTVTLKEGEYFLMGDNRNNSTDCRTIGAVARGKIVGKVYLHVKYGESIITALWRKIF